MEVASYLSDKAESVTVVGNSDIPFNAVLGPEIGSYIKQLHTNKNVKFAMGTQPTSFVTNAEGDVLEKVLLENGEEIKTDIAVLGIGVYPSTEYIKDESVHIDSRGYVLVDNCMKTNVANIFAVGDIASFPLDLPSFEGVRQLNIGHWQLANAHGKCAALNIATTDKHPLKTVPFFWTVQFGKSLRYSGCVPDGYDEILYDGNVQDGKFVAFYIKNDIVQSVATLMRDPVAADFANLLLEGKCLRADEIKEDKWRAKYSITAKI